MVGPDMQRLRRSYPPRSGVPRGRRRSCRPRRCWRGCSRRRSPPTSQTAVTVCSGGRAACGRVLGWLAEQPGATWQARWLVSGADAMGNAQWWRPLLACGRRNARAGVSTSSNLRVCALLLIGADVIRPSLDWVLTPRAPQNLVAVMARARDPDGFAELERVCCDAPARTDDEEVRRCAARRPSWRSRAEPCARSPSGTAWSCRWRSTAGRCARTRRWGSTSCSTRWACSARTPPRTLAGVRAPRASSARPS